MQARVLALVIAATFLMAPVSAHKFNHEDRHEECDIYDGPHGHFVGDGHAHTHDAAQAAADALHNHDPCKQIRMDYPSYEAALPLPPAAGAVDEATGYDLVFGDGDDATSHVAIAGEGYTFEVPEGGWKKQTNLVVVGDLQAAGMGFPGTGTEDDPYIIEGYALQGNMVLKDTAACFIVRNNIVVANSLEGPFLPDPFNIIELAERVPAAREALEVADSEILQWNLEAQEWVAVSQDWLTQNQEWLQRLEEMERTQQANQAEAQAWDEAFAAFELSYLDAINATETLADAFEAYVDEYAETEQPPREYAALLTDAVDLEALEPAFASYQQDVDGDGADDDVEGWILGNAPPAKPTSKFQEKREAKEANENGNGQGKGKSGSEKQSTPRGQEKKIQEDWKAARAEYQQFRDEILDEIASYEDVLMATAPDADAFAAFQTRQQDDEAAYQHTQAAYDEFLANWDVFKADHAAFQADMSVAIVDLASARDAARLTLDTASQYTFEYDGMLGFLLFNDIREIVDYVLNLSGVILDDAMQTAAATGRMVFDWNGQCLHAYNNVVHDLRVNQNNDRLGYATGGIIEDNRFHTIGQIRHYDGIFRENEVGNRAHLQSLSDPNVVPPGDRSINGDGANQGWYYGNTIYGQVDMDFHGHHHSAGFFASESHYHGSLADTAYMQADGVCKVTYDEVPNGYEYQDNDVDVLGYTILEQEDMQNCLPHHDHSKRWTSVLFNDNVVIDPAGVGLRFEDRNHRGDDADANSENMLELNQPHFHQKWVQFEDNVIVGKMLIDVLNAQGTDLWSDDWSEVQNAPGPGRTIEALAHPGAEVVNSHPVRNDAWLDIQRNTILQTQSTGVLVADADDLALFQLKDNRAIALPAGGQPGMDDAALLAWIWGANDAGADALWQAIQAWGGEDRGMQTFAALINVRDAFTVEHCGNVVRGLDQGFVAKNRIIDDGQSIIKACGTSDYGDADPAVEIRYTPAPPGFENSPTQPARDATGGTDDFGVSEYVYDTADSLL